MREIWKPIKGYKNYEVSNLGRVRSIDHITWAFHNASKKKICFKFKGRILHQNISNKGYLKVGLPDGNHLVHELILKTFRGPCPKGKISRHKNGKKLNVKLSNLIWGTFRENNLDTLSHGNGANKFTVKEVKKILLSKKSVSELQKQFHRKIKSKATIYNILSKKSWRHI